MMNKYYFLYKNSVNVWSTAVNPIFIAKHTYCRAIPKKVIADLGYNLVSDFVYDLNKKDFINDKFNSTIYEWDLF